MNSINNSTLSFKSKIVFVSPKTYRTIRKKIEKLPACENITNWDVVPSDVKTFWKGEKAWCGWRRDIINGHTEGVRSCTAGICPDISETSLFWHIENTKPNLENLHKLKPYLMGTNAIIIGSKSICTHSKAVFEKFTKYAKKNNVPTTIFQDLKLHWQANLAYVRKTDTLYLNINNIDSPWKYVKSLQELHNTFTKVKISSMDTVEFPSRIKNFLLRFKNFE